ncbi:MAG: FRG domain-containing protein [Bacteroidales bacterium]|nr:FRG domain-containing protein [Bacteroidales bacterium]
MDKITSIESYLEWVRNCKYIQVADLTWQQDHLFFRGQADAEWKLTPSIFRKPGTDENKLLRDTFRYAWKYLQEYPTNLEKMIVLQHYGLHTRLLDLTSNPLIALFFACSDEEKKDGKVFCYCADGEENEYYPKLIADMVMKNIFNSTEYDMIIESERKSLNIPNERFEKWKKELYTPQFFLSPYNNNRVTAQRGAFIIAPLRPSDNPQHQFHEKQIEGMPNWHKNQALIDKDSKKSLLKELALMGIDISTVYPDFEHLLSFLNQQSQKADDLKIDI